MGIEEVENKIRKRLDEMVARGRSVSAYLNTVVLDEFKEAQNIRWQTEGASEGMKWPSLNPLYARRKKKRFSAFPGGGNAMMVATARLSSGAMGKDSSYYYKAVTDKSFVFGINLGELPYAKYPGQRRPFMAFSEATLKKWHRGITQYIARGTRR